MGDKHKQKLKAKFELLTQSLTSYHVVNRYVVLGEFPDTYREELNEKPLIREEKPYGYHEGLFVEEYPRIYLRDIFKISSDFNYDLVLEFDGWHKIYRTSQPPLASVNINDKVLTPELIKYSMQLGGRERTVIRYKFTIPVALVKESVDFGYIRRQYGSFPSKIDCHISFQSNGELIKNVTSFSIFDEEYYEESTKLEKFNRISDPVFNIVPNFTVRRNKDGTVALDGQKKSTFKESNRLLINVMPSIKNGYEDPPYGHRINYLQGGYLRSYGNRRPSWRTQTEDNILIKFFDVDLTNPRLDDHYNDVLPGTYDCSFIETSGPINGRLSFRLLDPRSLPSTTIQSKVSDGKIREEKFFRLSNENCPKSDSYQFNEYAKKFYVMLPMDDGAVRGIKLRQFTPGGEPVDNITAIANTNGVRVTVEPWKKLPLFWQDKNGQLRKGVVFNSENNIYKRVKSRSELSVYYPNEQVMVHKQINTSFGRIPNSNQMAKATDSYLVEVTSDYYCTVAEYKPQPGYEQVSTMEGVTVDVWDCIKHVVKNRIGWTNADYFIVIQYTTAKDIKKKSSALNKSFHQNTLWSSPYWIKDEKGIPNIKNEKRKLKELKPGIVHEVFRDEMWGINQLNPSVGLDGVKKNNRLQLHFGQGTDVVVVGAVRNKRVEYHMIKTTGQLMAWWGRPYNY